MTDYDRTLLSKTIQGQLTKKRPIVILHGTDTMVKSASFCMDDFKNLNLKLEVPLIFTGAMRPMGFDDSDATQNVTEALIAAQILTPGFYISFHNRIFTLPNVRKNKVKRTFESF